MQRYLSAQDAADELGISLATLYAYVSRGLIRSEAGSDSTRKRRYNADDVQRLKDRRESRHNPEKLAESALYFGTPLLDSAITLIEEGRLYYRGMDAAYLARAETVERVAALIWTGDMAAEIRPRPLNLPPGWNAVMAQADGLSLFERFQVALPLAGAGDFTGYDLRPAAVVQTGANILRLLSLMVAGGEVDTDTPISRVIAQVWGQPQAERLISAALILCADHELNISAFTARCVASAGAAPYAVVGAGLAALQGTKHGGNTSRVEALLREASTPEQARDVIGERLKRGEMIPGFGHRLYPQGDIRARALLDMLGDDVPPLAVAVSEAVLDLTGELPNIDFALVTVARAWALPPGAPLALFALGRTIGWIGHALEQYTLDRLIRPRARYTGLPPQPNPG